MAYTFDRAAMVGIFCLSTLAAQPALAQSDSASASAAASSTAVETAEIELAPIAEEEARAFVESLIRNAFFVMNDEAVEESARIAQFRAVLSDGLAIDFLGEFMLGKHRDTLPEDQLAAYRELFPNYIMDVYADQIGRITRNELEIAGVVSRGRDTVVRTLLQRADSLEPIRVDWRLRRFDEGLRIVDIRADGVSNIVTKRDEFSGVIAASGMDGLLGVMRQRIEQS